MGPEVDRLFPSDVEVISEPGRYFAQAWSTLATLVYGKREVTPPPGSESGKRSFLYYLDDGVYGSFNCKIFDHANFHPIILNDAITDEVTTTNDAEEAFEDRATPSSMATNNTMHEATVEHVVPQGVRVRALHSAPSVRPLSTATLFGPTCDSMDQILNNVELPELHIGDWLCFTEMGAYTSAAASAFNGFAISKARYVNMDVASKPPIL